MRFSYHTESACATNKRKINETLPKPLLPSPSRKISHISKGTQKKKTTFFGSHLRSIDGFFSPPCRRPAAAGRSRDRCRRRPPHGDEKSKKPEKVDYFNLPYPVPFEEIQREAIMSLKAEFFEGLRFDFTKSLNQKFSLSHCVFMGAMEQQPPSGEPVKVPVANYEFGANFLDPKLMLVGRLMTDGRLNARVKCDLTDNFTMKLNAQLTNEPHYSQGMFNFDYKGHDYRAQFQFGNNAFYGANYIQSVTPNLSLGTEFFWLGHQRKSGIGFAIRYSTDKIVATAQVASTGIVALSYVQKVSEKVSLASDFMYQSNVKRCHSKFWL